MNLLMNNELLLLSRNDIPFIEAQMNIHQPTIAEIALIGERSFFSGCQFLNFSKDILSDEDKNALGDKSDFEVFMMIMNSKESLEYKNDALMVLTLLFPEYKIKITQSELLFASEKSTARINHQNFSAFKNILNTMFSLTEDGAVNGGYDPIDERAAKIAEKLKKAKKGKDSEVEKVAVFSRYISILAIGLQKDINQLLQYTVFQLKDEFKRFQKKQEFDFYMQAKMAGAKDLKEVDSWMEDIHATDNK